MRQNFFCQRRFYFWTVKKCICLMKKKFRIHDWVFVPSDGYIPEYKFFESVEKLLFSFLIIFSWKNVSDNICFELFFFQNLSLEHFLLEYFSMEYISENFFFWKTLKLIFCFVAFPWLRRNLSFFLFLLSNQTDKECNGLITMIHGTNYGLNKPINVKSTHVWIIL